MTDSKPFPLPDLAHGPTAPLWQAAARNEFALPRCETCGTFDWYPKGQCRQCHGDRIVWVALSGHGTLFSWAVVKRALHHNAGGVIFGHPHPSGQCEPSRADEFLTQTLKSALSLVDVRVLDHMVVSGSTCTSFAERGLL